MGLHSSQHHGKPRWARAGLLAASAAIVVCSSGPVLAQAIVTVAGGGPKNAPAVSSSLARPYFLALGPQGDLFISEAGGSRDAVLRMDVAGSLFRTAGYAAADCT